MPTKVVNDWRLSQLRDQGGKRFLITGGNSGVGLAAAKHLRRANSDVMIACRSTTKGIAAVRQIEAIPGAGSVTLIQMDLSRMASVEQAADSVRESVDGLDGIVNNAGIMAPPQQETEDGFEAQFATNHLGHFLLNYLLFDLVEAKAGRIVPVSSWAHRQSPSIRLDDPMFRNGYSPSGAYVHSKLANLMYGLELARRLEVAGSPVRSITAHPGYTSTNLGITGPTGAQRHVWKMLNHLALSPEVGSISEVLAAASDEASNGGFYGPTRLGDMRGPVGDSRVSPVARDLDSARRLWALSEDLLGIQWRIASSQV